MALTTEQQQGILKYAIALYGASAGGYFTELAAFVAEGNTPQTMARALAGSNSFKNQGFAFSDGSTNEQFATAFLNNLLGSSVTSGTMALVNTWFLNQIATVGRAQAVVNAIDTINATATTDPDLGAAKQQLDNRTAVASYYTIDLSGTSTDLSVLQSTVANVTSTTDVSTPAAIQAIIDNTPAATTGETYNLTTAQENITGTAHNDTFNGSNTTLLLDVLNGAAGVDTLNYSDAAGGTNLNGLGLTLTSIEKINVRSTGAATVTTTGFTGVTDLNILQGTNVTAIAATTTNVGVSDVSGTITIDGGKDITVTDATAAKDIVIGATTVNAGTITVTDTNVGAADVKVDGGTNVTLTLTGSTGGGKVITVGNGGAATDLPSGAVVVTSNNKATAATDEALNAITVKGGSTVTVTQTATSTAAAADTTGATVTQGDVTVVGGNATTSVTVAQAKSTAEVVAVTAVAGVTETASVKFTALTAGQTLVMGGLTFTVAAGKSLTAAEAAAVFSNLVNGTIPVAGDTQSAGPASKGTYTGAFTGWTSGAVSGDTVVFTSTTANTDVANLANTGTGGVTVTTTTGSGATAAKTGVLGVKNGVVLIDDNATASITTVSVDGYAEGSKIGNTTSLTKLASLTLANSGSTTAGTATGDMTVDATGVASLNLSINNIKGAVSLDGAGDSALKTLNLTTTGSDSSFALTAAAVETLTIDGTKKATLSSGTFTALKSITLSGSAGAVFDADEADTLTSVNTSATTGIFTGSINGTLATFTGGAGVDTVTLVTGTALTKAIDLGAGDDTLSFAALAVTGSSATLSGGDGTDTLSMNAAAADGLDGSVQSFYTNFERLTINAAYGDDDDTLDTLTLNLANLGFTNYVTTSGTVADTTTVSNSDVLALDKMASNGTVVLTAQGRVTVGVTDAATGTADVLNTILSSTGALTAGLLTVANVETININSDDTDTTAHVNTLTLTADKATTVNVTGDAGLTLTLTGSTKVATIDGSTMTKALTVTSLNTTSATTIKGGSAADVLTAATGTTADVLIGNAGDDTLTANAGLSTLTGGAGNDLFVIGTASLNSSSYSTITDFAAGDLIKMTGADSFAASQVALGDTAVFQDYCNAAVNAIGNDDVAWFQYAGNTYIVMDESTTDSTTFINGEDFIVKLTGLVDLTNASFNATQSTIGL